MTISGKRHALLFAMASTLVLGASAASANTTFNDSTGNYTVGIGPDGELFDNGSYIGLKNNINGGDWISPGTPRDSWGITSGDGSAYADYEYYGTSGITGSTLTNGTNTANIVTTTAMGLTVGQTYSFFAPNILSIQELITNTSDHAQNVTFRREVDLDVYPSTFNENTVGPFGANSDVVGASYYGFESPDPASPFGSSCFSGCNATGDLGIGIDIGLGSLASGDSRTFAYYYGINKSGQSLNQLFLQAQGLGLSYLIGTQSLENGQWPNQGANSGFMGVSALDVIAHSDAPEPATWAIMMLGLFGLGAALRRSRRQTATATA